MALHRNLSGDDLHSPKGPYPTPCPVPDNTQNAYLIQEVDTSAPRVDYINIDTTDGAEEVTIGNTTTNPKLLQAGTGNVGLGTTNPQEKVDISVTGVNGGIRVINDTDNAYLKLDAPTDEAAYVDFSTGGNNDWQIGRRPGSNDLTVYDNDGAADYVFTWEAGGNVGIGTTNPSTKLHVDGAVTVNGKVSGVATPVATTDAANKAYVDAVAPSAWDGTSGSSPVLGGNLDCNGNNILFDADTGFKDDSAGPQLTFGKTTSAVNGFAMTNAATGGNATAATITAPVLRSIGSDSNIDLGLETTGTGTVTVVGRNSNGASGVLSINNEADTFAVNITVPLADSLGADYTLTLPADDGDAGEYLQTDGSGNLSWAAASGGGGLTVETQNSTTALTGTDKFVKADSSGAAITLTLPAAATAGSGAVFVIKDIGNASTNAITLDGNAAETIDGQTTQTINSDYASMEVVCDGSNWWVR